jgi:hypothetical protein
MWLEHLPWRQPRRTSVAEWNTIQNCKTANAEVPFRRRIDGVPPSAPHVLHKLQAIRKLFFSYPFHMFEEKVMSHKVSIEMITSYFCPSINESMMLYHQNFIRDYKIGADYCSSCPSI